MQAMIFQSDTGLEHKNRPKFAARALPRGHCERRPATTGASRSDRSPASARTSSGSCTRPEPLRHEMRGAGRQCGEAF